MKTKFKKKVDYEEALKILNVKEGSVIVYSLTLFPFSGKKNSAHKRLIKYLDAGASMAEINKNYDHLFKANDVAQGGSFYLQSKIYRSKEAIDEKMMAKKSGEDRKSDAPPDHVDPDKP